MRRIFIFLLAGCLVFGLIEPTAATAIELIENGGFETGDFAGWTLWHWPTVVDSWYINDGSLTHPPITGDYDAYARGRPISVSQEKWLSNNIFLVSDNRILSATLSWVDRIDSMYGFGMHQGFYVYIGCTEPRNRIPVFYTQPGDPPVQIGPNYRSFNVTSAIRSVAACMNPYVSFKVESFMYNIDVSLDDVSLEVEYLPKERYGSYITLYGQGFFNDYTGGGDDVDAIEFEDSGSYNGPCYVQSATGKARASAATHEVGVFVSGSAALNASCPSARLTGTCGATAIVEDTIYIHSDTLPEGTPVNIIGRFHHDGNLFLTGMGSDSAWWSYYATLGAPPYLLKVEQQELYGPPLNEPVLIDGEETITTRVGDTLPLYIELRAAPGRTAIEPGNTGTNIFDFYGTFSFKIGYARDYEDIIIFSDAGAPIAPPPCANDFDDDGDVDGSDLFQEINAGGPNIDQFAADFGRNNCP